MKKKSKIELIPCYQDRWVAYHITIWVLYENVVCCIRNKSKASCGFELFFKKKGINKKLKFYEEIITWVSCLAKQNIACHKFEEKRQKQSISK